MKLGITELVALIGDEKIGVQFIDECAIGFKKVKHGTKIEFGSTQTFDFNGATNCGIILWIDRKVVAEAKEKWEQKKKETTANEDPQVRG